MTNEMRKEIFIGTALVLFLVLAYMYLGNSGKGMATPLERAEPTLIDLELRTEFFSADHPQDDIERELDEMEKEVKR